MDSLDNTASCKLMDQFSCLCSVLCCKHQFCFSRSRHLDFCILIDITIGMTCQCDRLLPVSDTGLDSLYYDGRTEYSSIKDRTDRTIRTLPHLLQIIFCHSGCIWCNGRTFNSHTILFRSLRTLHSYPVISLISMFQPKIIIFCLQINIRNKQLILDHLPEDPGHFIPVHFHERGGHFYLLSHTLFLSYSCSSFL